jgi:hypothetical protein
MTVSAQWQEITDILQRVESLGVVCSSEETDLLERLREAVASAEKILLSNREILVYREFRRRLS